MSTNTRTLLVKMTDGTQKKVSGIPDNAKVTFSKVNPGADRGYGDPYALRIYTTQSNQLAVFLGVTEFRDLSLTVESRSTSTKVKKKSVRDGDGVLVESADQFEAEHKWEVEDI